MSNILIEVVRKHFEDTLKGNNRDELNYVDIIYPAIEFVFGFNVCYHSISDKDIFERAYNDNIGADLDFKGFVSYLNDVKELCNRINDKDKLLKIESDLHEFVVNLSEYKLELQKRK